MRFWLRFLLLLLVTTSLACRVNLGGPEPPGPPIPVSDEAAAEVELAWNAAGEDPDQLIVILSEQQVTSFLVDRLNDQIDPLLQNPQVYLRQGQIQIFGTVSQATWEANLAFIIAPGIDPQGNIELEVVSAELGPFPAPESVRESLSVILSEAFTGEVGPFATGIKLTSIAISDGQIALVGEIR
jgi:hypothetical protein